MFLQINKAFISFPQVYSQDERVVYITGISKPFIT